MQRSFILALVTALSVCVLRPASAEVVLDTFAHVVDAQFDGNLSAPGAQEDLEAVSYPADPAEVTFSNETIGGEEAQVANFADGTYFAVRHGAGKNSGGGYVNKYTIVMDVRFTDAASGWVALYSSNNGYPPTNDGEAFLNPSGGGIGISGDYEGETMADTWYRIAIVCDSAQSSLKFYIDGALVNDHTIDGVDGRWTLYRYPEDGRDALFHLFGDDTGPDEMSGGAINSLLFVDTCLTDDQIAELGGPTAAGIPRPTLPERVPSLGAMGLAALAALLLGLGALAIGRRRRLAAA